MLPQIRAVVAGVLVVAHAATAQQPSVQGQIRTGTYDLAIVFGGGELTGSMELASSGDSLVVKMFVGDHQSPVKIGERKGNKLTLVSTSPAMALKYELEFFGDTVKGTFVYDGSPGSVTGKLRKQELAAAR